MTPDLWRMMNRNYPTSSFADPLAPPAQTAAWAYERSTASIKPSSSYGATHPETEQLHRQTYASPHQLPTYVTAHHPTGLSGVFDAGLLTTGSNTTESSVMSFLSAIESRTQQAGPAGATLFPQFRTSSWQTGVNSSPTTELFVTGALPSSGTFSTYQHPNAFPTRTLNSSPSLTLQDTTFSTSSNGLLSNDPLLQIKSTQVTVPSALAFDRLGGTVLTTSLPPQSSTYRSAQESAPHLLQPQFGLLPSALSGSQQPPQPYSTSVFSGSIERALQRECSVIKHHQRPSSTQSVQGQHSLQGYLSSRSEVPYQDTLHQPAVPCSPIEDSTQVSNAGPQKKTSQSTMEQTQAYPPSTSSTKHTEQPLEVEESHSGSPNLRPPSYNSPSQKQNSVIASQPQAFVSGQLPSPPQVYITSQSLPSSIAHSQVYSSSQSNKLPPLHKSLTSVPGQSGNISSVKQPLIFSSGQQQGLPLVSHTEAYRVQVLGLCPENPSQSYSSSHSQGLPTVSYSAQSQGLASVSSSQSYASGQSLTLTSQSLSFSSTHAQNLPRSSPTQNYAIMHPSPGDETENTLSPQTQKYLPSVQSPPFSPMPHSQALQNNRSSADLKTSCDERKSEMFTTSKQEDGEFPVQDLQALQQQASLDPSAQALEDGELGLQNNDMSMISKMDDRYNSQSVIRSNSRPEDEIAGLIVPESKKDERMSSLSPHGQEITSANSHFSATPDIKRSSSHATMSTEELKQQSLMQKVAESQLQSHQTQAVSSLQPAHGHSAQHTQYLRLPGAQILPEPSRDLQMVLLQQSLLNPTEPQQIPVQYLQMDDQIIGTNSGQSQQQVSLPQNPDVLKMDAMETTRSLQHHISPKDNFSQVNQHDAKHHFTLSSICFPDSILLADERNILSNVDDILAATAAACGVTPQEFAKVTSSVGDMPLLTNTTDSKGNLQGALNTRHVSSSFSSQQLAISNSQAMTLNGSHLTMLPKEAVQDQQATELPNSHIQSSLLNFRLNIGEKALRSQQEPQSARQGFEREREDRIEEEHMRHGNRTVFSSVRISTSDPGVASDNGFPPGRDDYDPTRLLDKTNMSSCKNQVQCSELKTIKMEDTFIEFPTRCLTKKKVKSKGSMKLVGEEMNGHLKPVKRNQGKRQNSRGSDTNLPSTSDGCYESYHQQERMQQKIREVEEKQPEVKTGFIGSFLDFLKSGPKQQFSSPPIRMPNRSRKSSASSKRTSCPMLLSTKPQPHITQLAPPEMDSISPSRRLDEELKRNLETLPSFSSDEEESVGKNQDLQKSITSALSALDDPSEKKSRLDVTQKNLPSTVIKHEQSPCTFPSAQKTQQSPLAASAELLAQTLLKGVPPDQLAAQLTSVAIEGLTDEELSDSGGEGMYRERDEFVVKNEDIECLKMTLNAGCEPPAIWKVQKALLQKFVPELRNGTRVFSATNSYLGYFGDAKTLYRRVYVKFIDTVNKREYVRVCSRKPRCKPMHSMRGSQARSLLAHKTISSATAGDAPVSKHASLKASSKVKSKVRVEPPPKKRKTWKEGFSEPLGLSPEAMSEDDEFTPPVPFASRFLNTRTMKETFRSYVELLISVALDADLMDALEKEKDELLLPHMRKVEGMLTDNRRRLLPRLRVGQLFKNALDSFPELSLVTALEKDGENPSLKVQLSGKAYNRKTLRPSKASSKLPLEYTVEKEKTQWFSLYHSLQHYKYHTFLICKDEIASVRTQRGGCLGQEETVKLCLRNGSWVERLFHKFGELLTQVQQTCL
ncbi:glutamine and serine-rich protein 1-like isoform X2 [Anguilla rostrata]|uniref:glutamine and serine-rich protein 1-like isoform X2 n=1 Tax=Anguilla rostrata TaxID=7938 RepID=UPI0030CAE220